MKTKIEFPCETCISFAICRTKLPSVVAIERLDMLMYVVSKCSIIQKEFMEIDKPKMPGLSATIWHHNMLKLIILFERKVKVNGI